MSPCTVPVFECVSSTDVGETVAAFLWMTKWTVDASGAFSPSVWLLGARTRLSRGPLVNNDQREPWTVKKGKQGSQQDAESIWDVPDELSNPGLWLLLLRVCGPHLRTPAPGRHRSKGWWRAQRVVAASGISCGPSSARRTWCSGLPARIWRRRPTRLWLRRRSVKYTRTSSPSSLRKRWGFDEERSTHFCLTFAALAMQRNKPPMCDAPPLTSSRSVWIRKFETWLTGRCWSQPHTRSRRPNSRSTRWCRGTRTRASSTQPHTQISWRAWRSLIPSHKTDAHFSPPQKRKKKGACVPPEGRTCLSPAGVQDKHVLTGCGPAVTALFRCD